MNSWNSKNVRSHYDQQMMGFLTNFDGRTELHPTQVALAFRKLVLEEGSDPNSLETLEKAREPSRHVINPQFPFETLNWGTFTMMLSELGKQKELDDLLEYADEKLNPTWENGGLFYPRNDQLADEEWHLTHVEPHSGNSGIGYARLNVEDGQKKMWEKPWTREQLADKPWVDGSFADVDFLRAIWDGDAMAMIMTLRRWQGQGLVELEVKGLPSGQWAIYVDGKLKSSIQLPEGENLPIREVVGEAEVDVVVART